MLSFGMLKMKGSEAAGYYAKYPAHGDALGDEIPGIVFSTAATQKLSMNSVVSTQEIEDLMMGKWNGIALVQGAGDHHRSGIDMTFSAPKSVSVLKAASEIAGDSLADDIQKAHDNAVKKALELTQKTCIHSRTGKAGRGGNIDGSMIAVSYAHQTSRLGDPQIHSHNIIMNLVAGDDGKWRTLSNEELLHSKMKIGAAYRAELSKNLVEIGLHVEADSRSFAVSGIDKSVVKHFSKRREEITKLAEKYGVSSAKLLDLLTQNSKKAKDKSLAMSEIQKSWHDQIIELGLTPAEIISASRHIKNDEKIHVVARDAVLDALTSENAAFKLKDLETHAYIICSHVGIGADDAEKLARELAEDSEIVALGKGMFTTKKMLQLEVSTIAWSREANNANNFSLDLDMIDSVISKNSLTKQQASALRTLAGGEAIGLLEGMAGTGKSYLMSAYREVAEASGFTVRGAALAGKAAQGLQEGAGIESTTLHRLLIDIENGKTTLTDRDIIVIDEAAMIDTELLAKIAKECRISGAKAVLLGDSRQLQAIGAGGLFQHLTQSFGSASLTEIWRQNSDQEIDAVHQFACGDAGAALKFYKDNNRLHIDSKTDNVQKSLVSAWFDDSNDFINKTMIAGRRDDVLKLNLLAREKLSESLAGSQIFNAKDGEMEVSSGERLLFKKNDKDLGVMNGSTGTVEQIRTDALTGLTYINVLLDDGKKIRFEASAYDEIRYGYAVTAHAVQGDTKQSAYVYASKFMSREMAYVVGSRHKEHSEIYASDEEFFEFGGNVTENMDTEEKLKFVMSQSGQKKTALQVMKDNNQGSSDTLKSATKDGKEKVVVSSISM